MSFVDFDTVRGVDGYFAAFPKALEGLAGKRLRAVVEAVHSGVLEGWRPTEEDVAAIAQRSNKGALTKDEVQEICERIDKRYESGV